MIYAIDQITLKIDQQQVLNNGMPIPLSARGHLCLIEFLQADGDVLTKEHLMSVLWPDLIVSDDSLFKVIQEVRSALTVIGVNKNALKNIYGKGYQLQALVKEVMDLEPGRKGQVLLFLIGAALVLAVVYANWSQQEAINEATFVAIISDIEADHMDVDIDFSALGVGHKSTALDQLKLAYLKGLQEYKSGNYTQSIQLLNDGIEVYADGTSNSVIADANLLLSKMFIYRNDKELLQQFLAAAKTHYLNIDNKTGLINTAISKARYYQSVFQFEDSIKLLNKVLVDATDLDDQYNVMRVYANMAYAHQQLGHTQEYINMLDKTLEMSLTLADGRYAAYAYGELSQVYMKEGEPNKAMKFAQQALNFVLAQKDTNVFQQGFSAYYNLLHELGHIELAEKYLQAAIDIQAQFNDEALLVLAELNLVRVKVTQKKYNQAKNILLKLLNAELSEAELLETESLRALVSYKLQDNITAYTAAKQVLSGEGVNHKVQAQAGIVMALASYELERDSETKLVFKEIEALMRSNWRYEYTQFLELAQLYYKQVEPSQVQSQLTSKKQMMLHEQNNSIIDQTQTSDDLINTLDLYIQKIVIK